MAPNGYAGIVGAAMEQELPRRARKLTTAVRVGEASAYLGPPPLCAASSLAGSLATMTPLLWGHMTPRSEWELKCSFAATHSATFSLNGPLNAFALQLPAHLKLKD